MTLAEQIQVLTNRRVELRAELEDIERELLDAGVALQTTVNSQYFKLRRGRKINGTSCRARILTELSVGGAMEARDICARIPVPALSVAAQLSRMTQDGEIRRVARGVYELATAVDVVGQSPESPI